MYIYIHIGLDNLFAHCSASICSYGTISNQCYVTKSNSWATFKNSLIYDIPLQLAVSFHMLPMKLGPVIIIPVPSSWPLAIHLHIDHSFQVVSWINCQDLVARPEGESNWWTLWDFMFKKKTSLKFLLDIAQWSFLMSFWGGAKFCITPRGLSHIWLSIWSEFGGGIAVFHNFCLPLFSKKRPSYKSFIEKVISHNQLLGFWALPLIPQTLHSTTETPWIPPDVLQVGRACLSKTLWAATSLMFVAHIWATQIIDWKGVHWSYQRFGKILHRLDSHLLFPISAAIFII